MNILLLNYTSEHSTDLTDLVRARNSQYLCLADINGRRAPTGLTGGAGGDRHSTRVVLDAALWAAGRLSGLS